jgi:hypothetical protein
MKRRSQNHEEGIKIQLPFTDAAGLADGPVQQPLGSGWVLIQAVGQIAISYSPVMNGLFHTAPIGPEAWLRIFGLARLASMVVAVDKRFRRHIL